MRIYIFLMIVISPTLIALVLHVIIYKYVRSSTRRVNPTVQTTDNDLHTVQNRRDSHLLRRMMIIFGIFVGGWSPLYIYSIIIPDFSFALLPSSLLTCLAKLCLLTDIISLYIYNQPLRKYLLNLICKCSHIVE